jgi:tol-pal system protein YbgF
MKILSKSTFATLTFALLASLPLASHAGVFDDDEARKAILDLRAKVEALSKDLNARIDTKTDKTAALEFVNQHEMAMAEIAKLRGQIEVLANEVSKAQQRQKDFYVELDARLRKLEPRKVSIDGKEADIDPNEQKSYDAAFALFKSGDFKNAAAALQDFVHRYPASGYAAIAQYGLGNSYYALRDYPNAIAAQQVVVSKFADSPKAPDAMLNIASCYIELKDKKTAKKVLQDLIAKFPDSTSAQAAKERLATIK